jgi:opacity protein-like surface antigen
MLIAKKAGLVAMLRAALMALLGLMTPLADTQAQGLLDMLEAEEEEPVNYAFATFKTTRLISGHSVETNSGKELYFIIGHRFGRINGGASEFFGLDNATIRLGLEYGITDRLGVGLGRSSFQKLYDGFIKYKLLQQKSGAENFPMTVTLFSSAAIQTLPWPEPERPNYFSSRMYYTFQVLAARKFSEGFSLQLSPTLVHRNLVDSVQNANDVFALGVGARQKLTGSLSLNAEYFYIFPGQINGKLNGEKVRNALSIGLDLETGGHVFQLHVSNSRGMAEKLFITETTGNWLDGDLHFGFNISRVFSLGRTQAPEPPAGSVW